MNEVSRVVNEKERERRERERRGVCAIGNGGVCWNERGGERGALPSASRCRARPPLAASK